MDKVDKGQKDDAWQNDNCCAIEDQGARLGDKSGV